MSRTDIQTLVQQAINSYISGAAVVISASDGGPLHGTQTFAEGGPGQHLCVSFPDVDRAAFQNANVTDALEQARLGYLERWKLRQQP
jgi:hypothetical protein